MEEKEDRNSGKFDDPKMKTVLKKVYPEKRN
jgi:hypothetical protein